MCTSRSCDNVLAQGSTRVTTSFQRAVLSLQADIFKASKAAAKEFNTHLQGGANIAGFLKVADAMVRVPG